MDLSDVPAKVSNWKTDLTTIEFQTTIAQLLNTLKLEYEKDSNTLLKNTEHSPVYQWLLYNQRNPLNYKDFETWSQLTPQELTPLQLSFAQKTDEYMQTERKDKKGVSLPINLEPPNKGGSSSDSTVTVPSKISTKKESANLNINLESPNKGGSSSDSTVTVPSKIGKKK